MRKNYQIYSTDRKLGVKIGLRIFCKILFGKNYVSPNISASNYNEKKEDKNPHLLTTWKRKEDTLETFPIGR